MLRLSISILIFLQVIYTFYLFRKIAKADSNSKFQIALKGLAWLLTFNSAMAALLFCDAILEIINA